MQIATISKGDACQTQSLVSLILSALRSFAPYVVITVTAAKQTMIPRSSCGIRGSLMKQKAMNEIQNGTVWNKIMTIDRGANGMAMLKNKKPQCPMSTRHNKVYFYCDGKREIGFLPANAFHKSEMTMNGIDLRN